MDRVSVVIPTRNRRDLVQALLLNLRAQTVTPAEIIVVDDGSEDGTAEAAVELGARVIEGRTLGFARAVNLGVQASRHQWVAVLNNDLELESEWLARLLEAAEAARAWFACGKLLDFRRAGRIDGTFDLLSRGACAWRAGHGRPDGPLWNCPRTVQFAGFTAVLLRRELFERVGWLDERFHSYLEDVEFCLRCALAELHGVYVPAARGRHAGSATLGRWSRESVRLIARNQLWLIAKHYPDGWFKLYGRAVVAAQWLWGLTAARHGAFGAYLRGKQQGWQGFRDIRESSPRPKAPERLQAVLRDSERQIRSLQEQGGWDWYWRAYFLAVGSGGADSGAAPGPAGAVA